MRMQEIYEIIDRLAPFDTQEDFDNAGFLIGDPNREVTGIHVALDASMRVLDEAEANGANLLITHHPLFFHPRKNLLEDDCEGRVVTRMIRGRMGLIAAHTNWDKAPGGINDVLARLCGIPDFIGEGYWRAGPLETPCSIPALIRRLSVSLNTVIRPMGPLSAWSEVDTLGVSGGAGCDYWKDAWRENAQVFVTGEVKHHVALEAADAGVVLLEAGHFATEEPGIFALADTLQNELNGVQSPLRITRSACGAYALPGGSPKEVTPDGSP